MGCKDMSDFEWVKYGMPFCVVCGNWHNGRCAEGEGDSRDCHGD